LIRSENRRKGPKFEKFPVKFPVSREFEGGDRFARDWLVSQAVRSVRRRGAIGNRRNDAGRQEGEGSEQADVPFAMGLTRGNLGEGGNAVEPDVVDPSPGLGDGGEQSVPAFGLHRWIYARLMNDALHGREAWRGPGKGDHGRRIKVGSRIS
jgi:hypothetical protein